MVEFEEEDLQKLVEKAVVVVQKVNVLEALRKRTKKKDQINEIIERNFVLRVRKSRVAADAIIIDAESCSKIANVREGIMDSIDVAVVVMDGRVLIRTFEEGGNMRRLCMVNNARTARMVIEGTIWRTNGGNSSVRCAKNRRAHKLKNARKGMSI